MGEWTPPALTPSPSGIPNPSLALLLSLSRELASENTGPTAALRQHKVRMKCPLASTNKRFLINTIKNTLPPDREKHSRRSEDEKETGDHSRERRHSEKHSAHPYKRSDDSRKDKKGSQSSSKSTRHSQSKGEGKRR
ncbi:unnamed protein product [Ranitomeya imitator]|uniref:Uncharacterized protein n=1 Tax=Ranitomeya imitator TaxID=111125 RepID=A0ABN9MQ40_9NEOB|nr:unnamed protein product [Ranitomeya imitator]